MIRYLPCLIWICLGLLLAGCKAECPPERIAYIDDLSLFPAKDTANENAPTWIEIRGKQVQVDRVVSGPVCNDTFEGTIYLTCDIQIPSWERDPFFFQACDFEVAEDALIYVEAHRDKRYDKGCSCHE